MLQVNFTAAKQSDFAFLFLFWGEINSWNPHQEQICLNQHSVGLEITLRLLPMYKEQDTEMKQNQRWMILKQDTWLYREDTGTHQVPIWWSALNFLLVTITQRLVTVLHLLIIIERLAHQSYWLVIISCKIIAHLAFSLNPQHCQHPQDCHLLSVITSQSPSFLRSEVSHINKCILVHLNPLLRFLVSFNFVVHII